MTARNCVNRPDDEMTLSEFIKLSRNTPHFSEDDGENSRVRFKKLNITNVHAVTVIGPTVCTEHDYSIKEMSKRCGDGANSPVSLPR